MSYNIYKSFSVKNGKCRYNTAESNLFDVSTGIDGRKYYKYIFKNGEKDFQTNSQICTHWDNSTGLNDCYGLSDIQLYTKLMLSSAYCGNRFYQSKHTAVIKAIHNWADKKSQKDREVFAKLHNINAEILEENSYKKEFRDKYGDFDNNRIYINPTTDEFDELVILVKATLGNLKIANRKQNVIIEIIEQYDKSCRFYVKSIRKNGSLITVRYPQTVSIKTSALAKFADDANVYTGYKFKIISS